jgi:hypothetical protein
MSSRANAQFAGVTGNARYEASVKPGTQHYGSASFYPFASFASGGNFGNGTSGTRTDFGTLFAADFGVKPAKSRNSYEVGGWYWTKGGSDLYQLQGRVYFTPEMGVQLAYLGSTKVSGNSYTAFLLYDLASNKVAPTAKKKWTIQTGLGLLMDPTGGRTTVSPTVFVQFSTMVAKNISVNAGIWTLRDRSTDITRYVLGSSYRF